MKTRNRKKSLSFLAVTVAAAIVIPVTAADLYTFTSTTLTHTITVDFSDTTTLANHLNYSIFHWSEHPRSRAVKYIDFDITTAFPSAARGNCFELSTYGGPDGLPADTEILVRNDAGSWVRLSDDYNGTSFSMARLLLSDNIFTTQNNVGNQSPTKFRIAAYGTGNNKDQFTVSLKLVGNLSEADCTGNASKAAVYMDRHEFIRIIRAI